MATSAISCIAPDFRTRTPGSAALLLLRDREEPGADDRTPRPAASTRRRSGRTGSRCRRWTVLGLKEIRHVPDRIDADGLRTTYRRNRRHDNVLVRRILVHDDHVARVAAGNVDQLLRRVPPQRVDLVAVGDRRHDLSGRAVHHDRGLAASHEDPVGRAVVRDACRVFTRRDRPGLDRLPRPDVNHLDRVLALVVDVDPSFSIRRCAFRRNVLELGRADDVPVLGVDRDQRADRAAVIRQDDPVVVLVVHDAVETAVRHLDLLDDGQVARSNIVTVESPPLVVKP